MPDRTEGMLLRQSSHAGFHYVRWVYLLWDHHHHHHQANDGGDDNN